LLRARAPRVLDWLPWNHGFNESHEFNMMLANGGGFYIDDGLPTPGGFARGLENLGVQPGSLSFNVPTGFAMLMRELRRNDALKRRHFAELDLILNAGAALAQEVWEALEDFAMQIRGSAPLMRSSRGVTEAAPAALLAHAPMGCVAVVGVPAPGAARPAPARVMRAEDAAGTLASIDDKGFLIAGDVVRFADGGDPSRRLMFGRRIFEDFKLMTGT
jgi:feruloyl-CoA synthase